MAEYCTTTGNRNDLTARKAAWLLWYTPAAVVLLGWFWARGRPWLWVPAFLVMGGGCLANPRDAGDCTVTSLARSTFSPPFTLRFQR